MKLMKEEIIWLVVVMIFYIAFLMPGFPQYGDVKQTLLHGGITLSGLYITNYAGQMWINSKLKIRENNN